MRTSVVFFRASSRSASFSSHVPEGHVFGVPANARPGVGFRSIRDRAAILGGTVRWLSPGSSGTTVELEVPCGPREASEPPRAR
jgi:signal transduction histidine kinase